MKTSELRSLIRSTIEEILSENEEPEIIQVARRIVKNKQFEKVKDPVSKKKMALDMFSASGIVKVYDNLGDKNKSQFVSLPLPKMVDMTFKLLKKVS
jgi:hypothetical protein